VAGQRPAARERIHRGVVLCDDDVIRVEDIVLEQGDQTSTRSSDLTSRRVLATVERDLIIPRHARAPRNLTAAGRSLGIDRNLPALQIAEARIAAVTQRRRRRQKFLAVRS